MEQRTENLGLYREYAPEQEGTQGAHHKTPLWTLWRTRTHQAQVREVSRGQKERAGREVGVSLLGGGSPDSQELSQIQIRILPMWLRGPQLRLRRLFSQDARRLLGMLKLVL